MDHTNRSTEDSPEGHLNCGTQLKPSQRGRKVVSCLETVSLIFWQRMWLIFCPGPKHLPEVNLEFGIKGIS